MIEGLDFVDIVSQHVGLLAEEVNDYECECHVEPLEYYSTEDLVQLETLINAELQRRNEQRHS